MFNFRTFIKNGFLSAVGNLADYQVILNAAGWFEKGVLTEEDLSDIQSAIDEKNSRMETTTEEPIESSDKTDEVTVEEPIESSDKTVEVVG